MKKNIFIILISTFVFQSSFSQQNQIVETVDSLNFHLTYAFAGLGSGIGTFQPKIEINNINLFYTYEQNSYSGERNTRIDTICVTKFRKSSIDSIFDITKGLRDTTIFKCHPGIMSGGIHFLTVSNGIDSIHFHLMNTFDYTALQIVSILNSYLPKEKQIWANEKMVVDAEEYQAGLFRHATTMKSKKKKRMKKNGT